MTQYIGLDIACQERALLGNSLAPSRVSADSLVFERDESGPDEEFRLQFEALTAFDKDEKKAARTLLDALILNHQARRWASAS